MGLFNRLFGKSTKEKQGNNDPEQAVIIIFNYGIQDLDPLYELEEKLESVITENQVGEYDGHEIAVDYSDGILYMYGPNAELIFKVIKPTLESFDFMKGAFVRLRFGPPSDDTKEITITL